jgi:hypothetical protein
MKFMLHIQTPDYPLITFDNSTQAKEMPCLMSLNTSS